MNIMEEKSATSFLKKIIKNAIEIPNQIALTSNNVNYSYSELINRAITVSSILKEKDIKEQEVIALFLPSGYDLIASQLGVLLNKQIFVTIEPNTPKKRVEAILSDLDIRLLITFKETNFDKRFKTLNINNVKNEDIPLNALEFEDFNTFKSDASVYIISTSGSTGRPKNVEISYAGLDNFCKWQANYYRLDQESRVSSIAASGFDASIGEIWPALMVGATIVFPDPEKKTLPSYLVEWISSCRIHHCFIPTPLAEIMLTLEWPKESQLRTMIVAGDKMYSFPDKNIPFKIYNNYGPSEYTVCTTAGQVLSDHRDTYKTPTIGRPIKNTEVYILNEYQEKVNDGEIGQLFISGEGLAKGYYGDPELTKEKFIKNPFGTSVNTIMYKTGDLGKWTKDGDIEFCGRVDNQVKILGNRVEIEEITVSLRKHPDIKEAYTKVFFEDNQQNKTPYLVSYFSPKIYRQAPGEQEIYTHLEALLPKYMLPTKLILIHDFALNKNGKIDAKQLPNPEIQQLDNRKIDPPSNPLEENLVCFWCEILKRKNIGIHEDFFNLGGNSLAAIQILERIRSTYKIEITIKDFWKNATIHQLVKIIESSNKVSESANIQEIRKEGEIPLSVQQEQVWFLQQYAPNSNAYNAQTSLRIKGAINIPILEQTLQEIFNRHELLRTTYEEKDGKPKQKVHPNFIFSIDHIDIRSYENEEKEHERSKIKHQELAHIFNLKQLPLCRFTLIQIEDELFDLLLIEHHIVHDGVSYSLLMNELHTIYNDLVNGNKISLAPLAIQYADYSIWQRNKINSGAMDKHLNFWKNKLQDAPRLTPLPVDFARPKIQSFKGDQIRFDLPLSLSEKIKGFSKNNRVTLFSTMFTAFALLLHKYTLEDDINIGSAVANRQPHETERVIGMFVNAIVIRCLMDKKSSFLELARYIQDEIMEAHTHQSCPFPNIVKELNIKRDLSYNPIFQTMFSFHDAPVAEPVLGNAKCTIHEEGNSSAKQDIDVVIIPKSERYQGNSRFVDNRINIIWEYNKGLFERDSMVRMVNNYQFLLENLVDHYDKAVEEIPSVCNTELKMMTSHFNTKDDQNSTQSKINSYEQLLKTFKSNDKTVALHSQEGMTTYKDLYDQVKCIIKHLSSLDLKENDIVGLHLDKGVSMIASQIACLVYGVAFVPITPDTPSERKRYILTNANCKGLITNQDIEKEVVMDVMISIINLSSLISENEYLSLEDLQLLNVTGSNLAYVIYTSGSTGKPKGVMIPRKALLNYINWHIEEFSLTSKDKSTLLYSSGFDASLAEIWPPIAVGGTLYNVQKEDILNPTSLQKFIIENEITVCDVPTPLVERLLQLKWPSKSDLRIMLTGGQKLTVRPSKDINWKLYNQYGPTETTITATSSEVTSYCKISSLPSIGKPIKNTTIYVLDDQLNRVPIGGVGELYIGGDGLASGYLGDEELSKNTFISNPYSNHKEDKIYRTGDMVRVLISGELYFIGRRDTQVKIRGFRIELEEITKNVQEIEEVKKAHTFVRVYNNDEHLICCYTSNEKIKNRNSEVIKANLRKKLPEYMIPTHIVELDNMPLTSNGKIDEKKLPIPTLESKKDPVDIRPSSELEKHLIDIWNQILGHSNFSVTDKFFDLGGHSLKIVEMQSLIQEKIGVNIPIMTFFEYSTIVDISKYINGNDQKTDTVLENNNRASLRKKAMSRGVRIKNV